MINIKKKENCCGCNACGDICPTGAISFNTDQEGFWYPTIDENKCIRCNKCEKICPIINIKSIKKNDFAEPDCYVAEHKSLEVVFSSTSGGMFSALAECMYREGGYVGGAIHNQDFSVSHFISNNRNDLRNLRRSKDLQSNAEGFYKSVQTLLKNGKKVLVCGVPCQMAALRSFLGQDYENLIIIDLICLGVNSPKVWDKYIKSVEKKNDSKLIYTENKSKEFGWRNLTQKFVFENGKESFDIAADSPFVKGYVGTHLYCRPSCYECKFKGFPRMSDVSIGDFWGIENYDRSMDKDLGLSVVLVNSQKGKEYFEKISRRIIYKKTPLEWAVSGNPALLNPISKLSHNRNDFFLDLDRMEFDDVVQKYSDSIHLGFKAKIKNLLKPIWNKMKFVKKCIHVTRCNPIAVIQTVKYSGIKNLLKGYGILCGTNCVIKVEKGASLDIQGLLVLGVKERFPRSKVETRLLLAQGAKLRVKGDMYFAYGCDIEVFENAELILHGGKHSISDTNIGCTIICGERIEIMPDVSIGRNVLIRDGNGNHYMNTTGYKNTRPIVIGEKAWLCESCCIMPGVNVGSGAIVGAGSMVMSSIPSHALVSGSPAKVMNENVLWKR